jgi:hypothetical protein
VPGGIAMAFGITVAILAAMDYELISKRSDANILPIAGACAFGLGLIVMVFEIKSSNKIKTYLAKFKILDSGGCYNQDRLKEWYLDRVGHNTFRVKKNLESIDNLIRRYSEETPPKDWEIVRYKAASSREQTEELGKMIIFDFAQIVESVENPQLVESYGINILYYSLDLIDKTLRTEPACDKNLLRELRKSIRDQIARLDMAIKLLNQERKKMIACL